MQRRQTPERFDTPRRLRLQMLHLRSESGCPPLRPFRRAALALAGVLARPPEAARRSTFAL